MRGIRGLVFGLVSLACAGSLAAATTEPFDDGPWAKYFGPDYFAYVAMRGPKDLPGPVLAPYLKATQAALEKDTPDNPIGLAVKAKVLEHGFDLFQSGGAAAIAGGPKDGKVLMVLARTPAFDRFFDWAKKTFTKSPYELKPDAIDGTPVTLWFEKNKLELVIAVEERAVVMGDRKEHVAEALARARAGKKGLAAQRGYERLRPKVRADTALVALLLPSESLIAAIPQVPQFPGLDRAARVMIQAMTGNLIAVHGTDKRMEVEYFIAIDPKSEGYQQLKLDKRAKFYASRSVKAVEAIPGDAFMFATGLQPSYDTREIPASGTYMGFESSASNQQQWDVVKGQLQVHTGLSFDAEVMPWLGNEAAAFYRASAKGEFDIGALIEITDPAAAQASLEKAVRHIKISRGMPFAEETVGSTKVYRAQPPEGAPPFAPAACVMDKYLVIGTALDAVKATVQFPIKASASEAYLHLMEALGRKKILMLMWSQTAPIVRIIQKIDEANVKRGAPPTGIGRYLEPLESFGAGMAMPESDLVQAHAAFWAR